MAQVQSSDLDITVTGYLRRKPVEWKLDEIIRHIQAQGSGVVSVAYLDIDGFSRIESQYNYDLADAFLIAVAKYLKKFEEPESPAQAAMARWYVRDSFLIIYDELGLDDAFYAAEEVRRELSNSVFSVQSEDGQHAEINVTFSAGVATYPGDPEDRNELIELAEDAARRACEGGGNRTLFGRAVNMVPKTSHYLPTQLGRLRVLRERLSRSEASLLREALSDLLRKYDQRDARRELMRESRLSSQDI